MIINGTVTISLKDFDELREKAEWLQHLREELSQCSNIECIDNGEHTQQIVTIDKDKAREVLIDYALYGTKYDDFFEDVIIKFSDENKEIE